jgi:hypothetical protein
MIAVVAAAAGAEMEAAAGAAVAVMEAVAVMVAVAAVMVVVAAATKLFLHLQYLTEKEEWQTGAATREAEGLANCLRRVMREPLGRCHGHLSFHGKFMPRVTPNIPRLSQASPSDSKGLLLPLTRKP